MEPIYIPRHRLDVEEMVRASLRKSARRVITVCLLYGYLVGSIFFLVNLFLNGLPIGWSVEFGILVGVLVAGLMFVMSVTSARKAFRSPGYQLLFEDRTIVVEAQRIRIEYVNGAASIYPWITILKAEWGHELLLLNVTTNTFLFIPRRVLSAQSEEAIRNGLAQAKLQKGMGAPPRAVP